MVKLYLYYFKFILSLSRMERLIDASALFASCHRVDNQQLHQVSSPGIQMTNQISNFIHF